MNRNELREAVAAETGVSGAQADQVLGSVLDTIAGALSRGEKVTLAGFGTFETRERAARAGRNPQTGEAIQIKASTAPAFKPASALKKLVAKD